MSALVKRRAEPTRNLSPLNNSTALTSFTSPSACESGLSEEHKIGPYRAQVQARAAENGIFLVHANAPAQRDNLNLGGPSNGHRRIIGPDGNIIREAGPFDETMVIADIDLRHARSNSHPAALTNGPAAEWIRKGVELVAPN